MKCSKKKANSQIGVGVIVLAMLLLLSGIFSDSDNSSNSKSSYFKDKNSNSNNNYNDNDYEDNGIDDEIIFQLNDTEIGRQKKVTENFPNIELGSKEEINTIYVGNTFLLNANMFTANRQYVSFEVRDIEDVREFLIYFNGKRLSGDQNLIVRVNGEVVSNNRGRSIDLPIKFQNKYSNQSLRISFELEKPSFFEIFNWNKFEIRELKVVEVRQSSENNKREFDFELNKDDLERMYVDVIISCDEIKESSEAIKVTLNGFIISNSNPECVSKYNKITIGEVPKNVLKQGKNRIEFETRGYYKLAFSVNKIYYNEQFVYKFVMNNFNDLIDVIMYGEFDREVIDLKINKQAMTLSRYEIVSIYPYLRYGTNEIEFLNTPLEIEEFVIEKNQYYIE